MNPFDLSGPEFLVFYALLTIVVLAVAALVTRGNENGQSPRLDFTDPYGIAYLRGGASETVRVATVSLVDRGLLNVVGDASLAARDVEAMKETPLAIEKAVLDAFATPASAAHLFSEGRVSVACESYRTKLVSLGLLPNEEQEALRWTRFIVAAAVLLGVAALKLALAHQRGRHNVLFLVILTVTAVVVLRRATHPQRTARGSAVLADLRRLFATMRARSRRRGGLAENQAALLAAVFGLAALPAARFPWATKLFPQRSQGSSGSTCGTSCGSSCGSGCGGGGCGGGCGGCGG